MSHAEEVGAEVDGPGDRVVERPAVVGQVEVLDRELAPVVEIVERGAAPRRSRRRRVGSSTCTCVWPRLALAQLHVVGVLEQLAAGRRPSRRRGRCRRAAAARAPRLVHRAHGLERVHDRAGPRLEQRAAARRGTSAPRAPTCRRRPSARAWCTSLVAASGTRSGSRPAARASRDRRRASTSMCSKPSAARARARRRRRRGRARTTTSTTPSGYRHGQRARSALCSIARRHHHADVLEVLAEDLVEVLGDLGRRPAAVLATSTRSASGAGRACTRSRCGRGSGRSRAPACSDARNATSGAFSAGSCSGGGSSPDRSKQRRGHARRARRARPRSP